MKWSRGARLITSQRGVSDSVFKMSHRFRAETLYELCSEPEQVGGDIQVDADTNRGAQPDCRHTDGPADI